MNMATGDVRQTGHRLRRVAPATVERAMHFDQLDGDQQAAFLRLLDGCVPTTPLPTDHVIVFTDYYRVEPG